MLVICPLTHASVYVGETVRLSCFGSSFYFAGSLHFVLRRNPGAGRVSEELIGDLRGECAHARRFEYLNSNLQMGRRR